MYSETVWKESQYKRKRYRIDENIFIKGVNNYDKEFRMCISHYKQKKVKNKVINKYITQNL